ncbi:hypothetical protein TRVL_01538 [Trypanosoma vivax]|nr:hypothetical protein TRVL_01538 [Trypanosoma vivax]
MRIKQRRHLKNYLCYSVHCPLCPHLCTSNASPASVQKKEITALASPDPAPQGAPKLLACSELNYGRAPCYTTKVLQAYTFANGEAGKLGDERGKKRGKCNES